MKAALFGWHSLESYYNVNVKHWLALFNKTSVFVYSSTLVLWIFLDYIYWNDTALTGVSGIGSPNKNSIQ